MSAPFDFCLDFGTLIRSPYLGDIPSSELDKSYESNLEITKLKLRFREDIYTYMMRCIDLNLAWTDGKDEFYVFRNEEEYFKSTERLLKSKFRIRAELLAM